MAALADIFAAVRLQLDEKGFEAQAGRVGNRAGQTAGAKMSNQLNNKLKSALGGAVIGAAVVGGLQSATLAFGAFEQRMNEVFTLLPGISRTAMGKMQDDVKAFARETGKTTEEVIPGLYQAISAGVPQENVFDFLRTANKGAVSGVASLEEEVGLLSAVTKGFGDTSQEAVAKAADLAQLQVKLGQTTIPELAASYGKAVPLAAALGVSQEELAASSASLFGVTGNTAEVMTQLKAVFTALVTQNPQMTAALKGMGFETSEAAIEALGLQGTLDGLIKSTGGSTQALQKMLGSSEAVTAGLALGGAQAEVFTSNLAAMSEGAGTVDKAFEQMAQGGAFEAAKFAAKLETLAIDIGGVLAKFGPLPQIIATTFGPGMARAIGAGIGGLAGLVGPKLASALAGLLPTAIASGTAQGVAMGGAAAASAIATETAGVVTGQAAVGAAAAPAAAAAGTTIGGALGAAFSAALALAIPLAVAAAIVAAAIPVGEWFASVLPAELKGPGGQGWSEAQRRINEARAKMGLPPLGPGGRPLAHGNVTTGTEQFGPPTPPRTGGSSPDDRENEWTSGWSRGVDKLHADLVAATTAIKTSNDPTAVGAAIASAITAVIGGRGSAATTGDLIDNLRTQLIAAEASNNGPLAAQIKAAIAQLEPFQKGRQWQSEQLAKAQSVVDSNKTTAEKVAALKGIQSDLLSHQRTMAAGIVGKLIDVETAEKKTADAVRRIGDFGAPHPGSTNAGDPNATPQPLKPGPINPGGGKKRPQEFAAGGLFRPRQPMIVGELRPELLIPDVGGRIEPRVPEGVGAGGNTYNVEVQGLLRARDPFEIVTQLRRLGSFGVLTPSRMLR